MVLVLASIVERSLGSTVWYHCKCGMDKEP